MYATVEELAAYVEPNPDAQMPEEDAAAILLTSCSRDIDRLLGDYLADPMTGLKLAPPVVPLTAAQLGALARATCAQAEYRLQIGADEHAVGTDRVLGVGPVTISPTPWARYGPKVLEELAGSGLRVRSGTLAPAT